MQKAFTLIELSIALVIIGLITGGVLVGQDLIKAAQIRSVINERQQFLTAINAFKGKYDCVPGDCANGQLYFGGAAFNGNGNRILDTSSYETIGFWQQLALAGLINGQYDAIIAANPEVPGLDSPNSALSRDAGWVAFAAGYNPTRWLTGPNYFYERNGNLLGLGAVDTDSSGYFSGGVISAQDAKSIDDKIDDGEPSSGKQLTQKGYDGATWLSNCVSGNFNAAYGSLSWDMSSQNKYCRLVFFW